MAVNESPVKNREQALDAALSQIEKQFFHLPFYFYSSRIYEIGASARA